jgi:hypothetical protein
MQYLLTEEELKQLKRYDPNNLYNRLVTVLVSINSSHLNKEEKLKMYNTLAVDVGDRAQDGYEEAMLDAWESHFK